MSKAAKKTIKTWIKGLVAAALGGAVALILDPHSLINDPKTVGKIALGGAVIAVIGYLKASPLTSVLAEDEDETPSDAA